MKASMFLDKIGENTEFLNSDSREVKEFLEFLKDELLKENNDLKMRLELSLEEVERLKCTNIDSDETELKMTDLKTKIEKLEKAQNNNQYEAEFARMSFENANYKANREYYFNVIKEILKVVKKQKHQFKNAVGLLNEQDASEVINIMKDFKVTY